MMVRDFRIALAWGLALAGTAACRGDEPGAGELLNVSYDPTREVWRAFNQAFIPAYQKETGLQVSVKQSHGGSSSQARAVIDGLDADVVTLAGIRDTDAIMQHELIAPGWIDRLPNRSLPYTSTLVFVVRQGNPKGIRDWPDLLKPGVEVITTNPKTAGSGYLAFFAAWGSVTLRGGTRDDAVAFVTELYAHVPVLEPSARAAAMTFSQKQIGDVHLAWENEAYLEVAEAKGGLEMVYPPISILAEPHVAVVDDTVDRKGTRAAAEAYLRFAYTEEAQEIFAKHFYRPSNPAVLARHASSFPPLRRFAVTEIAPSFAEAYRELIGEGGVFDTLYWQRQ
jgi:sulfate transport system substrate-binding protein